MSDITSLTLTDLVKNIKDKKISSEETTKAFIDRGEKSRDLNTYITEDFTNALEKAKNFDQKPNFDLKLPGIPIAVKDLFCTNGLKTTAGSKILNNFVPSYESTVTQNIWNEGAILLGKLNCDEFAMGSSNETSFFGSVKNPWDKDFVPGGSSGGSAACVAARLASAATATDTGGSIRQPAALCGLTGIKPTYGRVSRYGMIAFASSLDQGGVLTRTAEDAAILMSSMSGYDPKDSTSLNVEVPNYADEINNDISGLKIGLPKEFFEQDMPEYVRKSIDQAIEVYKDLGAKIEEISFPNIDLALPVYYVLAPAECSANLSRYDGVRYGYRCEEPKNLEDLYMRTRDEGFGSEVKRRILIGTYALSAGYYDAYYLKAQKCRRLVANDFTEAFKSVDVILSPTTPGTSFKTGEKLDDPLDMYLQDIFTIPANLAGLPGISLPCGSHNGLPLGLQLIGNSLEEGKLLSVAHNFQKVTNWHKELPEL